MSKPACDSCENLREHAPEFSMNGVTEEICENLKNDEGLGVCGEVHTNCEDLHDANDCMIGMKVDTVEAFDVCDWKKFMKMILGNIYEMFKAIICSTCGLWEEVHKLWCWMHHVVDKPIQHTVHVYEDDDPTKRPINGFRIADGVVMRQPGPGSGPITLRILGTNARLGGSLMFEGNMPTDYTNGATVAWSHLQEGSTALTDKSGLTWGKDGQCSNRPLIYEFEITPCDYGFKRWWSLPRLEQASAGDFNFTVDAYTKGDTVPPDYSTRRANASTGEYYPGYYTYNPSDPDKMLIQVRLQDTRHALGEVSPWGIGIVIPCDEDWDC